MGVIEVGLLEQVYVTKESTSYANRVTAPASTDAVRAIDSALTIHHGRSASNQKNGTPDDFQALTARDQTAWDISSGMWEPSGTLGTASYWGPLLKGGMGAQHVIAAGLATTVNAAPSPTATGCTLISATGLQVGDLALFLVAGKLEPTIIRSIATLAVTFDTLSAAPDVAGACIAGVTYSLASVLADSFSISKFYNAATHQQQVTGAVVDNIHISVDGTKPVMISFKGPGAAHFRTGTTKPGAFTTAGAPAAGTVGNFLLDGNAFLASAAEIDIVNNITLRNNEIGTAVASGFFRTNNRKVTAKVTFWFDDTRVLTQADAITHTELRLLIGSVNGKMLAAILPNLEWEIPDIGKEIGGKVITATGVGYANVGNDSVILAEI